MQSQGMSSSSPINIMKAGLLPQEEMLAVENKRKKLNIGIPLDDKDCEYRVPLTPEAVEILVGEGHEIFIETKAGQNANYSDLDYSERGGVIVNNHNEVLQTDVILKVGPLTSDEIQIIKERSLIISSVFLNGQDEKYFRHLMKKKVTGIAFENIKDEFGVYPVMQSMSAISGNASVIIAGELLCTTSNGKGVLIGGVPGITPTEIIILGADTAAEYAIRAAIGMGATVKVFDHSVQRLKNLQDRIGQPLHTSIFHPKVLNKTLKAADVVIGSIFQEPTQSFLITEEMVKNMKKGSVIIDLTMGYGGCIETAKATTLNNPTYLVHDVIHYCVPNLPSRVSRTASIALSNVLLPVLQNIGRAGDIKQEIKHDKGLRHGVYLFNGMLTNAQIGNFFNIPSKDLDLLLAAF